MTRILFHPRKMVVAGNHLRCRSHSQQQSHKSQPNRTSSVGLYQSPLQIREAHPEQCHQLQQLPLETRAKGHVSEHVPQLWPHHHGRPVVLQVLILDTDLVSPGLRFRMHILGHPPCREELWLTLGHGAAAERTVAHLLCSELASANTHLFTCQAGSVPSTSPARAAPNR